MAALSDTDPLLAAVVARHGPPPLWDRPAGLESLVRIVLEQQVSLASGRSMYQRLESKLGHVDEHTLQACGTAGLRALGVTRQKAAYLVALAEDVAAGRLDLPGIAAAPPSEARRSLLGVKGVGPWTADVYLLMALGHPDVWPMGDIALHTAMQRLLDLPERPGTDAAELIARRWAPWRAVAARILWHGYLEGSLSRRTRTSG